MVPLPASSMRMGHTRDPRRRLLGVAAALAAMLAGGCAADGTRARRTGAGFVSDGADPTPVLRAEPVAEAYGPFPGETSPMDASVDTPSPRAAPSEEPRLWRDDGRPTWWLSVPMRDAGRVVVTAEAPAESVGVARKKAIDAARRALGAAAGAYGDETVDALLVRALPAGSAPGARFIAFARLSATPLPAPASEPRVSPSSVPAPTPRRRSGTRRCGTCPTGRGTRGSRTAATPASPACPPRSPSAPPPRRRRAG